ncbi:MAG: hypothetical protein JWO94_1535 [Verrucomicrobiaceae bacterium]|nr:hypothetical protein [Verrucomicrobiaceae bacterium]
MPGCANILFLAALTSGNSGRVEIILAKAAFSLEDRQE